MAQADGSITINTEIDTGGMRAGSREIEASARRMAQSVRGIGESAEDSMRRQVNSFARQNQAYAQQEQRVRQLREELRQLSEQRVETEGFRQLNRDIDRLSRQLESATERQTRFRETGGNINSTAYRRMEYDVERLNQRLEEANQSRRQLEESGRAYESPDTSRASERLENEERRLLQMHDSLSDSYDSIRERAQRYAESQNEVSSAQDRTSSSSSRLSSSLGRIGSVLKKIPALIAGVFVVKGISDFTSSAIELGSDLQEVQNVVDVTFTTMSNKIDEFAKNAIASAGLSETMAKQYAGMFGAMAKSFGFTEAEAFNMSTALTQLSGDVASFYNISQDEAYTKLKSVFTGETEALTELGVVMTETALDSYLLSKGINSSVSSMSEQEKVALRYQYVLEQLSLASGDFARTSGGWANQVRVMKLQIDSLKATIGQGLINIFTPIIKAINVVLGKLATVANAFKAFTELITGKKSSGGGNTGINDKGIESAAAGYNDAADAASNLGDSSKKAARGTKKASDASKKAAKEANGYLSKIDEINKANKETADAAGGSGGGGGAGGGGGSGGGGGAGGGGLVEDVDYGNLAEGENILDGLGGAFDKLIEKIKELAGLFVEGFWDGLGDYKPAIEDIIGDIQSIGQSLKDIFTDPEVIAAADNFANKLAYSLGQITGSLVNVGITIARNIIGGIEKYLSQNVDRIKQYIINIFNISSDIAEIVGNFAAALADIFSAFGSETAQQITANLIGIFAEIGMMVSETALKLGRDILDMLTRPIIENKDKIKTAIEGTLQAIEPFTSGLLTAVQTVRDAVSNIYDNHLKPLFDSIAGGLSEILGKILDAYNKYVVPVLQSLGEKFKSLMEGPFGGAVNQIAEFVGKLIDVLKILWENVLVPLLSWIGSTGMAILGKIVDIVGNAFIKAAEIAFNVITKIAEIATSFLTFLSEHKGVIEVIAAALIGLFSASRIVPEFIYQIGAVQRTLIIFAGKGKTIASAVMAAIKGVISIIAGGGGLKAALSAIVTALGGPLTIAIGAAIAAVILLITHFDEVKEVVGKLKDWIVEKWQQIKENTADVWNSVKETVSSAWNGLKESASNVFNSIKTAVETVWNGIKSTTSTIWNAIKSTITGIWNGIKTVASTVFNAIKTVVTTAWNGIKTVTSTVWNTIKSAILAVWNALKGNATTVFNKIKLAINVAWNAIKTLTTSTWSAIKSKVSGIWTNLKTSASNAFGKIKSVITNAWNGIKTATTSIWNGIKNAVKSPINAIIGFLNTLISGISSAINGLTGMLNNLSIDIPDWVPGVGGNSLGFNIPQVNAAKIPYLATGAVIPPNAPFMAMLGDQRNGNNLEMPESLLRKVVREESGGGNGGQYRFTAQINRRTLFDEMITEAKLRQGQNGRNPFELA